MKKVEHIGIAVKDLTRSNSVFEALFGESAYKTESVASENVSTSFFKIGDTKIELLESTNPNSAIGRFIEKRGEGVHHIAFEVDDIISEMKRLKDNGFTLLKDEPFKGADNKLVCFLHPKSTNHVLVELCQEIKE